MKMKLSKNQDLLIQHTVETQRATGRPAEFMIGQQHKTQTFESLIKRGLMKGKRGLFDGGGHYHRDHYQVEMTDKGWDHIYKIRPTIT